MKVKVLGLAGMCLSRSVLGKSVARFFVVLMAASALAGPVMGRESTAAPDLSGFWGRNSLSYETPSAGPGPV
jgi:hypothetical protein